MYFAHSECIRDLSQCSIQSLPCCKSKTYISIRSIASSSSSTLSTPSPSLNENLSENHFWHWNVFVEINRHLFAGFVIFFFFPHWLWGRTWVVCLWNFILHFQRLFRFEITSAYETFGVMIVADSIVYNNGYAHTHVCVSLFLFHSPERMPDSATIFNLNLVNWHKSNSISNYWIIHLTKKHRTSTEDEKKCTIPKFVHILFPLSAFFSLTFSFSFCWASLVRSNILIHFFTSPLCWKSVS